MKKNTLYITSLMLYLIGNATTTDAQPNTSGNKPKVEFVFQIADTNNNLTQLSNEDITKLQKFFNYQADIYDCDPQSVSLTAINLDENQKPTSRDVVGEIKQVGYAVMHLQCENNKVYFVINKSSKGTLFKKVDSVPSSKANYTTSTFNVLETNR